MSHIPSSAMPHAHAQDDDANGAQASRPAGEQPEAEPTTATPRQPEPAIGDGTVPAPLAGSATQLAQDMAAAGPSAEDGATDGRPEVDGTVTAKDHGAPARDADDDRRSPALIAAMVLGGLAALGGLVAAALPLLRDDKARNGKKGKKRKA